MRYGVQSAATERSIPAPEAARAIEERGFDSYWLPEHVHIPLRHTSRYPGSPDGVLPEAFSQLHDPFIALTAAAAATERIRLGTAVCLITEHEPIALAKTIGSIDVLSGGRFIFGIGAGWLREEMEPLGTPYAERWKVTEERTRAMRTLWTEPEPEFHGRHVDFPALVMRPKPIQRPHPPIYLGALSRWAPQRVVDYCDGWLPPGRSLESVASGMASIRELAPRAGRDPDSIPTTVFDAPLDLAPEYERLGVERCIFALPPLPRDAFLARLDELAKRLPPGQ